MRRGRWMAAVIALALTSAVAQLPEPPLPGSPTPPVDLSPIAAPPAGSAGQNLAPNTSNAPLSGSAPLPARTSVEQVLPPLDRLPAANPPALPRSVTVDHFEFTGNRAYSSNRLAREASRFVSVPGKVTSDQLEAVRAGLTDLYVKANYLTSGVRILPPDFNRGVITFEVVEGSRVEVRFPPAITPAPDDSMNGSMQHCDPQSKPPKKGHPLPYNFWYPTWWLRSELQRAAGQPVNFHDLQGGLELLRLETSIAQINAELQPGVKPGDSILDVRSMQVAWPFHFAVVMNNGRPPSVGEGYGEVHLSDQSLTLQGDALDLHWGLLRWNKDDNLSYDGFDNVGGTYQLPPITPWGTRLSIYASKSDASVVDETFAALGITSRTTNYGVTLSQPVHKKLENVVTASVTADWEHSQTFLQDEPFSLLPGAIDGTSNVFAIRFALEWVNRSQFHGLTFRSTFNLGLHAFGSTRAEENATGAVVSGASDAAGSNLQVPDSQFFSWRGQMQYAWRIFDSKRPPEKSDAVIARHLRETILLLRTNVQLSNRPLLSVEQFAIGGMDSVRGYRENQLLRDDGVFASVEMQIPLWLANDNTPIIAVAPFFDWGDGWNVNSAARSYQTIYSAGVGLIANPSKHAELRVYWGHPFVNFHEEKLSLQDYGIHFSATIKAF